MEKGIEFITELEPTEKRCKSCHVVFHRTSEYFHVSKTSNDGLLAVCKTCANTRNLEYIKNNPQKEKSKSMKHNYYLKQKAQGKRMQYKINRLVKEGRLIRLDDGSIQKTI
jgi:hypothetical protein